MGQERGTVEQELAGVDGVLGRIEKWRATRPTGKAMPDGLWEAAGELAKRHGVYRVSRALRLDYGALSRRLKAKVSGSAEPPGGALEIIARQRKPPKALNLPARRSVTGDRIVGALGKGEAARSGVEAMGFVELASMPGIGPGQRGVCSVELRDADGTGLHIRLEGAMNLDVASVVAAWRRRG